jgi:hypothetical protein
MSEVNLFEIASRKQFRFPSCKGSVTLEDLWEMPLDKGEFCLDKVAIGLKHDLEDSEQESFISRPTAGSRELGQKLELCKHIISVRLEERKARADAEARKQQKAELDEIIRGKKQEALKGKSVEELEAMRESL